MNYFREKEYYKKVFLWFLFPLLFFSIVLACSVGAADLTIGTGLNIILQKLPLLGPIIIKNPIIGSPNSIIWKIRMPRVLLAGIVGSALAYSGGVYQGLFKNPMAESFVLGVSSGAALGGTLGIVLGVSSVLGMGGIGALSFLGAILATLLVYQLGKHGGKVSMTSLLLAGIAVNFMLSACISLIMIFNRQRMNNVIMWTMGSFANATWEKLMVALIGILPPMVIVSFFSRDLNIMLMGEEEAYTLGVEVEKIKKILLVLSSLMAAIAVSVSGIIGFVGLVIPHGIRLLLGPDHRTLLPYSGLAGAIFLIIADTLARTLVSPMEIPVGIITALVGSPFFLYLLGINKRSV